MNCCIIGKGSIGKRHAKILKKLNIKVIFLRRKAYGSDEKSYQNIKYRHYDFFIISNPSSLHLLTINKLAKYNKPILVEKPLMVEKKIDKHLLKLKKCFVLYQMRFDPRINFIKKKLFQKKY